MRYILLMVISVNLSLTFSTVSSAEIRTDFSHELPLSHDHDASDDAELELEVHETPLGLFERPLQIFGQTLPEDIFGNCPTYFDSYYPSFDIPPLS